PQNDVTLKMPAFEWVHVQLHQQKGMISLSPPTICNSALLRTFSPSAGVFVLQSTNALPFLSLHFPEQKTRYRFYQQLVSE
ncbi:hypothetical protein QR259_23590, partial [Salmonella enterica]|nr:hypothetical protein [Salmonella enterica]